MDMTFYKTLQRTYSTFKVQEFENRYLGYEALQEYLVEKVFPNYSHQIIGQSELKRSIYEINVGHGDTKILIWSQMHGNETTTTKAILDLLNYIHLNPQEDAIKKVLSQCRIKFIPMLNPDGASEYNRLNANKKDLNRDAIEQSQPETQTFFNVLEQFKPDFCFNMHGQRTMYSAGQREYPATLSFLSPSVNKERTLTLARKRAMRLISSANKMLQDFIPLQIGRYDDTFNPNCFGDHIQSLGIPTVLFEAGHYPNNYYRNKTRQFIYMSLYHMLSLISDHTLDTLDHASYFDIPINQKLFFDCIITNTLNTAPYAIGLSYNEILNDGKIEFSPIVKDIGHLDSFFAFRYIDAKHQNILLDSSRQLEVGDQLNKIQIDEETIVLKFS